MTRDRLGSDGDESTVRALMRRSDGPVPIRSFRAEPRTRNFFPALAATAIALVVALVIGTNLGARRVVPAEAGPAATQPAPTSTATPSESAVATPRTPEAPGGAPPTSVGAVPEAGVLYVQGSDDQIYRYDGRTGEITAISSSSVFAAERSDGVLVIGRHLGAYLLGWDGSVQKAVCGNGAVFAVSASGACAIREQDGAIRVVMPRDVSAGRVIVPADWNAGLGWWDATGTRLALLRGIPGPDVTERAHNALWVYDTADGSLRELYRPRTLAAYLTEPRWSPDGRWITVHEMPISASIAADGVSLMLVDVEPGGATELGTTVGGSAWVSWAPNGSLAFIRGAGRETWQNKRLVVRKSDGSELELALPSRDHVQLAPAWSPSGELLLFVVGPAGPPGLAEYVVGVGVGDRRGLMVEAGRPAVPETSTEFDCPDGAVEGVRAAADDTSILLLCRAPGDGANPLSVWLVRPGNAAVPLIRDLPSGEPPSRGGFGFYGQPPNQFRIVAWSLGAN